MSSAAPPAAHPAAAERPLGVVRHVALASFWFGLFFHWTPILAVLVPYQVSVLVPRSEQGTGVAAVTALGAVFAVVLPPLVGAWSDRLTTRWGRRRPIMVVGTAGNVVGLVVIMLAPTFPVLIAGYLLVQITNNAAGAAFNGIVPDVVPEPEFGKASGMLGAMVQLGSVAGLAATLAMSALGHITWTYAVIAAVVALSLLPTLWAAQGEGRRPLPARPRRPLGEAVREFLAPLTKGDFAWVILTRTAVTAGIYCVLPFLEFFFRDVVRVAKPADFTAQWELLLLVAATPFGLAGGWASDRLGRKPFVYASGGLMTVVLIVYVVFFLTDQGLVLALGALFGVGYGLYYAVDWALACDTLPDPTQSAKDMGLFHVSYTLPQVVMPAIMGVLLDRANASGGGAGYRVVFATAAVFFVLGTVFVARIRSVR